jgi:hypothetical protein
MVTETRAGGTNLGDDRKKNRLVDDTSLRVKCKAGQRKRPAPWTHPRVGVT